MDRFLSHKNEVAKLIDRCAVDLYNRLQSIDVDALGLPSHCLEYYKASHSGRLFFSIETSAHLLYRAITFTGKKIDDIVLMDYGAGVGTLYLLAKLIGCRQVVYNDHLEEWKTSAALIADAVNVRIDEYIVGDIDHCLAELERMEITCSLITSRNVLEHIYRLDLFFKGIYHHQPQAIIFSSTTANHYNPAAVLKHRVWHRKWEKVYWGKRYNLITRKAPQIKASAARQLATASRGLAVNDLDSAIEEFLKTGSFPNPSTFGSNTCDPDNGVWAEHLIKEKAYRELINQKNYDVYVEAGFWDTHYSLQYKNFMGLLLNKLISSGIFALQLAPFIYVIARPKKLTSHT